MAIISSHHVSNSLVNGAAWVGEIAIASVMPICPLDSWAAGMCVGQHSRGRRGAPYRQRGFPCIDRRVVPSDAFSLETRQNNLKWAQNRSLLRLRVFLISYNSDLSHVPQVSLVYKWDTAALAMMETGRDIERGSNEELCSFLAPAFLCSVSICFLVATLKLIHHNRRRWQGKKDSFMCAILINQCEECIFDS